MLKVNFVYSKKSLEKTDWTAIFRIFSCGSWIMIGLSFIFLGLIILAIFKTSIYSVEWTIISVTKAFFAQSFDTEFIKKYDLRYHFLWVISIYGAFIFWYFTSVLISVMLVPAKRPTIDYFDDLLKENGYKVHMYGFGYIVSYIEKWKDSGRKEQQAFEDFIEPNFIKNDWDKYYKTPEILLNNNNPKEIFVEDTSYFPNSFGE